MEPRYVMFVKRQKSGDCDKPCLDLADRTLQNEPHWDLNRISILALLVCLCGFGIWASLEDTQRDLKIQPPLAGFPLAGIESKYRMQVKNKETRNKPQTNQIKNNHTQQKPTQTSPSLLVFIEELSHWALSKPTHDHVQTSWDTRRMSFLRKHFMLLWKKIIIWSSQSKPH